jgi:serine/threonine-protein kinase RsbW
MAALSVFADLAQLANIRDFVAQTGRELGLDDELIYNLQLAVDEACSNVVNHAYGGSGGLIKITIEPVGESLQVIIRDWGEAFDPSAVRVPDLAAPLEQRSLGGLGLFLMRGIMDRVEFQFDEENGNTLTMVKQL